MALFTLPNFSTHLQVRADGGVEGCIRGAEAPNAVHSHFPVEELALLLLHSRCHLL